MLLLATACYCLPLLATATACYCLLPATLNVTHTTNNCCPSTPHSQGAVTCNLWSVIHWESRDAWKALPPAVLAKVQADFVAAYGGDPVPMEMPTGNGFDIANSTGNWSRN